ncbi:rod shape-determining protein MreD [Pueribacillus theae]|uniref:Rod shape-determining protein MreD n=1 Tax=Pueribacillus theae TaxID=2171751 RepID=A0A2U1JZN4_9BACI|nr:rod shape-determining protein MreD [Pueribacillus theae]PWA10710.1 rod shape-determining protein MreD [Pueribacillus theae]
MKRIFLPLLLFFFFVFEGTVMQVVAPENYGSELVLVPRFTMVIIVLVAIYHSIPKAVVYAIVTGLLYDIIYTDLVGVYMFSMAITAYIVGQSAKIIHVNVIVGLLLTMIAIAILDFQVYGLYTLVGIVQLPIKLFLYERLFPSLILNSGFFILMFFPIRKLIDKID